ncbi:ribosome biogenesis GTPase Der [Tistrella mobilis]|uniref:ribosome biogenesis GTPase Der n=1 Tax=Tistrella mobilis TaxID=171437 RepID=UPI00355731ED
MLTVALVGRPNVGKSTLFNRLVGRRIAIVDDTPGVTRDRRMGEARLGNLRFNVVDTAGLEEIEDPSDLNARMQAQTRTAIDDADLVLFMIDGRAGITPSDEHFADLLRRVETPVVVVVNKCEGRAGDMGLAEAWGLGLGEPMPLSAAHGDHTSDLYDVLSAHGAAHAEALEDAAAAEAEAAAARRRAAARAGAEGAEAEELAEHGPREVGLDDFDDDGSDVDIDEDADEETLAAAEERAMAEIGRQKALQIAIVGRPNAGKSTLMNHLLGEERVLTGPEAGITRDAIAVDWLHAGRRIRLIDTAGMRRKARIDDRIEKMSVDETLRAIRFAHVVVLMIDAERGLEKQDMTIARLIVDEGRALVLAVNKWDTVTDADAFMTELRRRMSHVMPQVKGVPVVTISALAGHNTDRLIDACFDIYRIWNRRVSTGRLNRWLERMTENYPPPMANGRRLRLRYITQIKTRPPGFAIFVSQPKELPDSYVRYVVNGLRDSFDLPGVPVRVVLRTSENPFADRKKKR